MNLIPGNAQHIGARSSQQDSFGFGDPENASFLAHGGFAAVVCDGMGGMEHGDAASKTAVRAFLDAYSRKTPLESIPSALERSVREANESVLELSHNLGAPEGIGTTLVAVAIDEKRMYFVSVGDSAIFHLSNGQMQTVNRAHVFANLLDQAAARGTISREQALQHPERDSLTSFIGVDVLDEIDRNIDPLPLRENDTILLATDGLFKTLSTDEILASMNGNPQKWPETLVERTLAKKHEYQDNVTVLSVTLEKETATLELPPPAARAEAEPIAIPSPEPPKRNRAVWITVAALSGLAVAGGGWWYAKRHHTARPAAAAPAINQETK